MPKVKRKLTEAEIKNAKPKAKAYKLYDEGGLLLLIRPTGTKVWQLPFKLNGKYNVYTIGQYDPNGKPGSVGSAEARRLRDEAKVMIKSGLNPNNHMRPIRHGTDDENSFESVAREWHGKQVWEPKHARSIIMTLEKDVFPVIGHRHINTINAQDKLS